MPNVRVSDLAKELRMSFAELQAALGVLGIQVRGQSAEIDTATAQRMRTLLARKVGRAQAAAPAAPAATPPAPKKTVEIPPELTIRELGGLLKVDPTNLQKTLLKMNILATVNQTIGFDVAAKLSTRFGFEAHQKSAKQEQRLMAQPPRSSRNQVHRPPVVTIMGHVDHGKTTLLDAIRKSHVTEQEFGGITQHIGAYQVEYNKKKITFLDTPGHEAFTAMRARGAQSTDIAILVVAADDGVMPQTIEAINHAKSANVPIIVAINKIDKPEANPDRIKQQLTEHNLVVEEWGGDVIAVPLSAKQQIGLDDLLEYILLVAEVQDLKADPHGKAVGIIIEAELDRGRGPVATVLVQAGTLRVGDAVVAGAASGRVKAMVDDRGRKMVKASPATPAEIVGLSNVPHAGDHLEVVPDEKIAKQIALSRSEARRESRLASTQRITLDDLYKQIQEGEIKDLNLILKADVHGSLEAVRQSIEQIKHEEIRVKVIHEGVGNVGESDVLLASASNAIIIGFNVRVEPQIKKMADDEKVDIRLYRIIYDLTNDIRAAMMGMLSPITEEVVTGHAEVRQLFRLPNRGVVAGCMVSDGQIIRNADARVLRNKQAIHTGKISSLKHLKDDVREMNAGFECGIVIDNFTDFQPGDIIETFEVKETVRTA
ncbi:MAG: translation initiation factor IF-2 [Armatimonadetes bacterium]|nr:translation initiation factor IF-2 [Armatimonadota bacterium]